MAVSDQTRMALLGALSIAPATGYALREQVQDALGRFWAESFGQIYPALSALQAEGLVERREASRSGSSTFAITPAGLLRLRELLDEPPRTATPRNGLLLRLFFGRQLGPDAARRLVLDARGRAEAELTELAGIRAEVEKEIAGGAADAPYILLTVLAGEHSARASIAWANEALDVLDGLSGAEVSP
jgi:DNA-binding PadR family transcriptional regulator